MEVINFSFLSSSTDEVDKIKVLSAGADDYICKPFGLAELAIRIEVVLRRMRSVTPSRIRPLAKVRTL